MITKLYIALKMTFYLGSENGMCQTGKGTCGGGGGGVGGREADIEHGYLSSGCHETKGVHKHVHNISDHA